MLTIEPIPAFYDNYIWTLINTDTKKIIVVDPGDATPVLTWLAENNATLAAILVTHHHMDHIGGVEHLRQHSQAPVYGPKDEAIGHCDFPLTEGMHINLDKMAPIAFDIFNLPGHTLGHIAYYTPGILFCGDTLFSAGCGRIFEGTPAQMYHSLGKLAQLPPDTKVYCTHEYTEANLKFALTVEPHNMAIQQRIEDVAQKRQQQLPSLPSSIAIEHATNPFLRCTEAAVIQAVSQHSQQQLTAPLEVFTALRQWKDVF